MSTAKTTTPYEAPDFAQFITDLDHGKINQKLTDAMAKVADAVAETSLVGKLTVELTIRKEGAMATVAVVIKEKIPKYPLHSTLFHFGANGELLRDDPRQMKLKNLATPKPRIVED